MTLGTYRVMKTMNVNEGRCEGEIRSENRKIRRGHEQIQHTAIP